MGKEEGTEGMLPHERLGVYQLFLETERLCSDMASEAATQVAAWDHLDRAMESIGVNLIRANGQPSGSAQRGSYLDVSIASTHECAACFDVCLAKRVIEECKYSSGMQSLWRIRGMLLGLKRASRAHVREDEASYGSHEFPFAALDMYGLSLRAIRWLDDLLKELRPKARIQRRLDTSSTGTVLNIAEGYGRETAADQNRFMRIAQEHAYQTLVLLDVMGARREVTESRIAEGKATQARIVTMIHAWCSGDSYPDHSEA